MKGTIKTILVYFFIIFFVSKMFSQGLILPSNFTYLVATFLILVLTVLIVSPLLNFLTIKSKFPTFFLMSSIVLIGIFFLMKTFMIDFYIEPYLFKGLDFGSIQINSFLVTPVITILAASITSSFFCAIYKELDSV